MTNPMNTKRETKKALAPKAADAKKAVALKATGLSENATAADSRPIDAGELRGMIFMARTDAACNPPRCVKKSASPMRPFGTFRGKRQSDADYRKQLLKFASATERILKERGVPWYPTALERLQAKRDLAIEELVRLWTTPRSKQRSLNADHIYEAVDRLIIAELLVQHKWMKQRAVDYAAGKEPTW